MSDHDPVDTLVAGLRTEVPEMSDQAFAAGRARVRAVLAPAAVPTEPTRDVSVTPLRKRRLLRSPPRLIASAAAVVALVAGVLVVQTMRSQDTAPVASAAAAQLNSAADEVDAKDAPVAPGQYRYIAARSWAMASNHIVGRNGDTADLGLTYLSEQVRDLWVPADPQEQCLLRQGSTGRYTWVVGDDQKAGELGVELPKAETSDMRIPCGDFTGGAWQRPSTEFLASLPRDPGRLYDRLRRDTRGHGSDPDLEMLVYATDALSTGLVPADLRAALYRALAKVPGLEITEQVANLDGKKGTSYGISRAGERHDVIIDPATGDFIGARQVDLTGVSGAPAGTVISYSSVSNPVIVDEPGETR